MIVKAAAIYSIAVGLAMLGMWVLFYVMGSIPELITEPARILLHIVAECVTALALIIAGIGLLRQQRWSPRVYLLATGALLYTLIQSPGYFLQQGEIGFVIMFGALLLVGLILLVGMLKHMARMFPFT